MAISVKDEPQVLDFLHEKLTLLFVGVDQNRSCVEGLFSGCRTSYLPSFP